MEFFEESIIENQKIETIDNFIIRNNGNLILKNSTVSWNLNASGSGGLYVENGGTFKAYNCVFQGLNGKSYKCELFGNVQFYNCTFYNLWGDKNDLCGQGGIEIYSDNVLVEKCLIYNPTVTGIVIGDCSPRISNCTVAGCSNDGIEIINGAPLIINNQVEGCDFGIMTFHDCNAVIRNNTIKDINNYAIGLIEGSKAKLGNNHFSNTGEDIHDSNVWPIYCYVLIIIVNIIIIAFFSVMYSKRKREYLAHVAKELEKEKLNTSDPDPNGQ
jgi:hypothetical protein